MERIRFTLDDLLSRAELLMIGATKKAMTARPKKDHRLQRTSRHEATCTCRLWSCRTDEVVETEIAETFALQHALHVRRDKRQTTTQLKEKTK
jgi:hypothetical protein